VAALDDELATLAEQLMSVAEQLGDLALDRLRVAADPEATDGGEAELAERRITRARRAVVKAAVILAGPPLDVDGP
jgi:hypothetical protein